MAMTVHAFPSRHVAGLVGSFFGHVAALIVGFVLMVLGLGLGVTMIMLPVGLALGLLGFLIFLGGLFAHIDEHET
jgi:hypothetical protein